MNNSQTTHTINRHEQSPNHENSTDPYLIIPNSTTFFDGRATGISVAVDKDNPCTVLLQWEAAAIIVLQSSSPVLIRD
jgi:hypothetical protein